MSVTEADTRVNNFENIHDFNVVDYIGDKTEFCANDDKYRVDYKSVVNEYKSNEECQQVNGISIIVTNGNKGVRNDNE